MSAGFSSVGTWSICLLGSTHWILATRLARNVFEIRGNLESQLSTIRLPVHTYMSWMFRVWLVLCNKVAPSWAARSSKLFYRCNPSLGSEKNVFIQVFCPYVHSCRISILRGVIKNCYCFTCCLLGSTQRGICSLRSFNPVRSSIHLLTMLAGHWSSQDNPSIPVCCIRDLKARMTGAIQAIGSKTLDESLSKVLLVSCSIGS